MPADSIGWEDSGSYFMWQEQRHRQPLSVTDSYPQVQESNDGDSPVNFCLLNLYVDAVFFNFVFTSVITGLKHS